MPVVNSSKIFQFSLWVQRHAARDAAMDSGVHDPLLGNGDPYGVQEDPSSARHAPTPAVVIAGLASEPPLPCCIQPLQLCTGGCSHSSG